MALCSLVKFILVLIPTVNIKKALNSQEDVENT